MNTVAHLSDLHVGKDAATDASARCLCAALIEHRVPVTVVTGDVTHRGRTRELRTFEATFAPLLDAGRLEEEDVEAIASAVAAAPPEALIVLLLHHHPLPLPPDLFGERLANLLGWPNAAELKLGARLLERLRGSCDLVLHGHRHAPGEMELGSGSARPLRVWNAGSSTELGAFRIFAHAAGRLVSHRWQTSRNKPVRVHPWDRPGVVTDRSSRPC